MISSKTYKTLALFMSFLVLFGNIGVGMVEHHCMMKGKSVHLAGYNSLHHEKMGCTLENSTHEINYDTPSFHKKACCSDQAKYGQIEILSGSYFSLLKILKASAAFFVPPSFISFFPVSITHLHEVLRKSSNTEEIPRAFGRSLLVFVQSFLI